MTQNTNPVKTDKVTEIIANQIIEQLENGVVPWHKPWVGVGTMWSRSTGKAYKAINQMLLNQNGEYATFNQIVKEGGKVNKGAKGKIIIEYFCKARALTDENGSPLLDDEGEQLVKKTFSKRYVRVFNIEHDTNLEIKHNKAVEYPENPIEECEKVMGSYLTREKIKLTNDDKDRAYYSPMMDYINLPEMKQFKEVSEYYSTAFHEMAHSTGHSSRLNRKGFRDGEYAHFGDSTYSAEELIAEITSASIMNVLGVDTDKSFNNSVAYVESWLEALKNDKSMILTASTFSDKAMAMILEG